MVAFETFGDWTTMFLSVLLGVRLYLKLGIYI